MTTEATVLEDIPRSSEDIYTKCTVQGQHQWLGRELQPQRKLGKSRRSRRNPEGYRVTEAKEREYLKKQEWSTVPRASVRPGKMRVKVLLGFGDLEVIGDLERACLWSDQVDPVRPS